MHSVLRFQTISSYHVDIAQLIQKRMKFLVFFLDQCALFAQHCQHHLKTRVRPHRMWDIGRHQNKLTFTDLVGFSTNNELTFAFHNLY